MPETSDWRRKLILQKRKTWETVGSLRRRFTRMMESGMLSPDGFLSLCTMLDDLNTLFEESTDAAERACPNEHPEDTPVR